MSPPRVGMKTKRWYKLRNPRIRATWNKYNLYNLSRMSLPNPANRTFFQQKWAAKAATRGYHGEHILEGKWEKMFDRRIPAVVPMNPDYLALHDGSDESAGRGSGLDMAPPAPGTKSKTRTPRRTPYMPMVYHPVERRLDTAIWRALFASSARQARSFVVHGKVKVNGRKWKHPGYLLNPGDMFQVEPEAVLFGTGQQKTKFRQKQALSEAGFKRRLNAPLQPQPKKTTQRLAQTSQRQDEEFEEEDIQDAESEEAELEAVTAEEDGAPEIKKSLMSLRDQVKDILTSQKRDLSGKQLQTLRAFSKDLRSSISRASRVTASALDDLQAQFQSLTSKLATTKAPTASEAAVAADASTVNPETPPPGQTSSTLSEAAQEPSTNSKELDQALAKSAENPIDPFKGYLTPWRPRDWMSPFAFIPRYLEVNQKICSAVYIRHPVCYPGFAEVPTPFHHETSQLAFNWYLRRR